MRRVFWQRALTSLKRKDVGWARPRALAPFSAKWLWWLALACATACAPSRRPHRVTSTDADHAPPRRARTSPHFLRTGIEQFDFWVRPPRAYTPDAPAGLLLYFHGAGEPTPEPARSQRYPREPWDDALCDGLNLVCLHARFGDGMDDGQSAEKAEAALAAIATVHAEYKIIPGRGLLSAFSNGGRPLWALLSRLTADAHEHPGPAFPFSAVALYSPVLRGPTPTFSHLPRLSWYHTVGEHEWPFVRIGVTGWAHFNALARTRKEPNRPGPGLDLAFWLRPGVGHSMPEANEIAEVRAALRRADLFHAPFIYPPAFAKPALSTAVRWANERALGRARRAALEAMADSAERLKEQARELVRRIDAQAGATLAAFRELSRSDPALAQSLYATHLAQDFFGHPLAPALAKAAAALSSCHACVRALEATQTWLAHAADYTDATPRIRPEHLKRAETLHAQMKPGSLHARSLENWLALGDGQFAQRPIPPIEAAAHLERVRADGAPDEWRPEHALPAQKQAAPEARLHAGWNASGLHFWASLKEATEPTAQLEIWVERGGQREHFMHPLARAYRCRARLTNSGWEADSAPPLRCAAAPHGRELTLELSIPTAALPGERMLAPGELLGLDFTVRSGETRVLDFLPHAPEDHAWTRPSQWGRIRLRASLSAKAKRDMYAR